MKTKFNYSILSILLFLLTSPLLAQRGPGRNGADPEDLPAAPIDDYIWVLVLVALVFGILTIKTNAKRKKVVLK